MELLECPLDELMGMARASRDGLLTMRELGGYYPRDKNV